MFLRTQVRAAYTVEAALVMGICLVMVLTCIMLAFKIYSESTEYISQTEVSEMDVVEKFRLFQMGKDVVGGLKNADKL